jgi:hypothetical protein
LGGLGRARRARAKPKQPTKPKLKQMPKTTNEEENKSQQTLGQKKQEPTGNRNDTENN